MSNSNNNHKKLPMIKYTSREFDSIKNDLVNYTKRYYPETHRDFNQGSFGSMTLDLVSYVGDQLSFYLDYQVNESFLDSAVEYENVIRLARQLGYKEEGSKTASGLVSLYVIVPANIVGTGPDRNYLPTLKQGAEFRTANNATFMLVEDVRFDNDSNEIVVARVNESNGLPTDYAVRAIGKVISGRIVQEVASIGDFEKFRRVRLCRKLFLCLITRVTNIMKLTTCHRM